MLAFLIAVTAFISVIAGSSESDWPKCEEDEAKREKQAAIVVDYEDVGCYDKEKLCNTVYDNLHLTSTIKKDCHDALEVLLKQHLKEREIMETEIKSSTGDYESLQSILIRQFSTEIKKYKRACIQNLAKVKFTTEDPNSRKKDEL